MKNTLSLFIFLSIAINASQISNLNPLGQIGQARFVQNQFQNQKQSDFVNPGTFIPTGPNTPRHAPSHNPGATTYSNKGMWNNVKITGDCPCAGGSCPTCGPSGFAGPIQPCGCAPTPICPPCLIAKTMKQMHEMASSNAQQDANTQNKLFQESELEKKLFDQAAFYAGEAMKEEEAAKQSAIQLQEHASKAQIFRNKLYRAEGQAKQIALNAIKTVTIHPPHEMVGVPGVHVEATGYKTTQLHQATPTYQLNIGPTDSSGFQDLIHQELPRMENEAALEEQQAELIEAREEQQEQTTPETIEEAQLQQDENSSELQALQGE